MRTTWERQIRGLLAVQEMGQEGVEEIVAGCFGVVFDRDGFSDWTAGIGGVELAIVDLQHSVVQGDVKVAVILEVVVVHGQEILGPVHHGLSRLRFLRAMKLAGRFQGVQETSITIPAGHLAILKWVVVMKGSDQPCPTRLGWLRGGAQALLLRHRSLLSRSWVPHRAVRCAFRQFSRPNPTRKPLLNFCHRRP